jgi:hypothetical protein
MYVLQYDAEKREMAGFILHELQHNVGCGRVRRRQAARSADRARTRIGRMVRMMQYRYE